MVWTTSQKKRDRVKGYVDKQINVPSLSPSTGLSSLLDGSCAEMIDRGNGWKQQRVQLAATTLNRHHERIAKSGAGLLHTSEEDILPTIESSDLDWSVSRIWC